MRNYLKSEELVYITEMMLKKETSVEREIVKVALVAQLLLEEELKDKEFEDCFEIYNYVLENHSDLEQEISNYYLLDCIVSEELGINNTVKKFLGDLSTKIDYAMENLSNVDLQSTLSELQNLIDKNDVKGND